MLVHDVWFDTRGGQRRLWVADRTNNRIEIFTPDGEYVEEKTGFRRPNGMWIDRAGYMYVAELDQRVTIMDPQDNVIGHIGGHGADDLLGPEVERAYPARAPGTLLKPHCIWGDSQGASTSPRSRMAPGSRSSGASSLRPSTGAVAPGSRCVARRRRRSPTAPATRSRPGEPQRQRRHAGGATPRPAPWRPPRPSG